MNLTEIKKINKKIDITETEYLNYVNFFLEEKEKDERLSLYQEIKETQSLSSLAEAKHELLKNIFSTYIHKSLNEANELVSLSKEKEAKNILDNISKLRKVFKNHDVVGYEDFIVNSDNNINNVEVELLFLEPSLNKKDIEKLTEAFIFAFGKKNTEIENKIDFQRKFIKHPLINCLDVQKNFKDIEVSIEKEQIVLGYYKNLIKAMIALRSQINAEEYQGFITYLIKEDLTFGFSNITKSSNYKPKSLKNLLSNIISGKEIDDESIKATIKEIKENHTENLAISSKGDLKKNKNSQFSLNDYGFNVNFNGSNIFFHGHATENNGGNQKGQQSNTSHILRNFNKDSFGLTVLKNNVTRVDHHGTFLREKKLEALLNLTKTEEVFLSCLQFDSETMKQVYLAKNIINTDYLSSNGCIVKSDIDRSVRIMEENFGKNDSTLMIEKKNVYMNIIEKNKDFFKRILNLTTTENELAYQLLTKPIIEFITLAIKTELKNKLNIFTGKEIDLIQDIFSLSSINLDAELMRSNLIDLVAMRVPQSKEIDNSLFNKIKNLCESDPELVSTSESNDVIDKSIIKNNDLDSVNDYIEKNINSFKKKKEINLFKNKIIHEMNKHLNYRVDKNIFLKENIVEILDIINNGDEVNFTKSDKYSNRYPLSKTLAVLLSDENKTKDQNNFDKTLFSSILLLSDLTGGSINCSSYPDLKKKLKS